MQSDSQRIQPTVWGLNRSTKSGFNHKCVQILIMSLVLWVVQRSHVFTSLKDGLPENIPIERWWWCDGYGIDSDCIGKETAFPEEAWKSGAVFIACGDEIGQVVSIMFDLHLPSGDACVWFNYQLLDYHPTHCKCLVINICELYCYHVC